MTVSARAAPSLPIKEITVDASAMVMAALSRAPRPVTVTQLTRATGQPRVTVERTLILLAADGRTVRHVDWFEDRLVVRWAPRT